MSASRVVTFGLLLLHITFAVGIMVSVLSELISGTFLSDTLHIYLPRERISCEHLIIAHWEEFYEKYDNSILRRYFYVIHLNVTVANIGDSSYTVEDFETFDLFILFSKNDGKEDMPQLTSSVLRIPYKRSCTHATAPCWYIIRISALAYPAASKTDELVNTSGVWNPNEVAEIGIYLTKDLKFTLIQLWKDSQVIGGDGWIYITLVTPSGHVAKPINLFRKVWLLREVIE